ncbi:hypothetical protein CCY01nite_36870 [Chitinophaga cymbidii]|uniref:Uncharacterized protein n=1 Tax=Chitinophaga cymbidii TaxID=1096750 RepID=A0A512RP17_9BACT|nr:hypothetical protein CCY01nite_36870 [Chitinophaga cymbidii]
MIAILSEGLFGIAQYGVAGAGAAGFGDGYVDVPQDVAFEQHRFFIQDNGITSRFYPADLDRQ